MEFERRNLEDVIQEYQKFINDNQDIHRDTIEYLKYLEYRNKIKVRMAYIEEQVSIYNCNEINYKNRLINHNCRDILFKLTEEGRNYVEEIQYIDEKILKLKQDLNVYYQIENYKNDIRRYQKRIEEIDKIFEEEFVFVTNSDKNRYYWHHSKN